MQALLLDSAGHGGVAVPELVIHPMKARAQYLDDI